MLAAVGARRERPAGSGYHAVMLVRSRARAAALVTAAVLGVATGRLDAQSTARAAGGVTTPKAQFGFDIGADYQLATYRQLAEYWRKLDA